MTLEAEHLYYLEGVRWGAVLGGAIRWETVRWETVRWGAIRQLQHPCIAHN